MRNILLISVLIVSTACLNYAFVLVAEHFRLKKLRKELGEVTKRVRRMTARDLDKKGDSHEREEDS